MFINLSNNIFLLFIITNCIVLSLNLLLRILSPVWILLLLELLFFSIIICFFLISLNLNELYGYFLSYTLIISVAIESATLLGLLLILNKTIFLNQ